jgi:hypothetical protein
VIQTLTALIGVSGVVFATLWNGRRQSKAMTREMVSRVGTPNGDGTVVEMLTTALEQIGEMRGEMRAHAQDPHAHR